MAKRFIEISSECYPLLNGTQFERNKLRDSSKFTVRNVILSSTVPKETKRQNNTELDTDSGRLSSAQRDKKMKFNILLI